MLVQRILKFHDTDPALGGNRFRFGESQLW
jgi:hypothetical protein